MSCTEIIWNLSTLHVHVHRWHLWMSMQPGKGAVEDLRRHLSWMAGRFILRHGHNRHGMTLYDMVWHGMTWYDMVWLESRRRRTKGSVVGEEWCQNAAPVRWYTKNVFAQSKMILSRAWLHDTVSCAAWNDARKGVYLKPLFKTPCSNCYWGWSKPIMLDYRDISLMESVPLLWRSVTASPVGIEPMTSLEGGPLSLISNT